jgi:hypothetical protein
VGLLAIDQWLRYLFTALLYPRENLPYEYTLSSKTESSSRLISLFQYPVLIGPLHLSSHLDIPCIILPSIWILSYHITPEEKQEVSCSQSFFPTFHQRRKKISFPRLNKLFKLRNATISPPRYFIQGICRVIL